MKNKRATICAGGASIRQGMWNTPVKQLPLWDKIKDEFTIGINWDFKFHNSTVELYGDYEFYIAEKDNLEKLPLVLAPQDGFYGRERERQHNRTEWTNIYHYSHDIYLLKNRIIEQVDGKQIVYHEMDGWKKGFYRGILTGSLAIHLAILLGYTEIYLLGFDGNSINGKTHYYEDEFIGFSKKESGRKKTGIGFDKNGNFNTSYYQQDINESFEVFLKSLDKVKIINVSPDSKISLFPKISYEKFYKRLENKQNLISQDNLRHDIKKVYYEKYFN